MRNLPSRSASNSIQYSIGILLITASLAEIAHAAPIETSLQRSIGQALASRSARTLTLPARSDDSLVEAIKTDDASGWVFGTATQILREDESGDPVTKLFIARNVNGRWISGVEGSSQFGALLDAAPPRCSRPTSGKIWRRDAHRLHHDRLHCRNRALRCRGSRMPGGIGRAVHTAGPDKAGRITPSISGGNGRVLAARDGYLYKSCERDGSAIVKVVHDNGYATTYYHMVRLTSLNSGTRVRQGTISAASETACRAADKRRGHMFTFH